MFGQESLPRLEQQIINVLRRLAGREARWAAFVYPDNMRHRDLFTVIQRMVHRIPALQPRLYRVQEKEVAFDNGSTLRLLKEYEAHTKLRGIDWHAIEIHDDIDNDALRDEAVLIVDRCDRHRASSTP